jgi:hypothetical protein
MFRGDLEVTPSEFLAEAVPKMVQKSGMEVIRGPPFW